MDGTVLTAASLVSRWIAEMCGGSSTLLCIGTKEDKASPRIKEKNHGIRIRNALSIVGTVS